MAGKHGRKKRRKILAQEWVRWGAPVALFLWTLLVHLSFLSGDLLWSRPFGPLFAGDALYYLEQARYLAQGENLGSQLPFHPPGTSWLLVPLWWILDTPGLVYASSKVLMAVIPGSTYALFFILVRGRLPLALPISFLLPLSFGELLLSSAVNAEVPYRLLLLAAIGLGFRWPVLGGVIHGLAALTRAEHLLLVFGLFVLAMCFKDKRRFAALSLAGAALLLVPYTVWTAKVIGNYNMEHAEDLPQPLPVVVPVSFYGPLNFALAQTEDDIFFSRRNLPVAESDPRALLPTDPEHNRFIVDGMEVGWERIRSDPSRFLGRTARRAVHSVKALGHGWSWRDVPNPDHWIRRPVDLSYLLRVLSTRVLPCFWWWPEPGFCGGSVSSSALGLSLLAFRLGMNALFFPYLRGMAICSPFLLVLFFSGLTPVFKKYTGRALVAFLLILSLFHLSTAWKLRNYSIDGERDAAGTIIDDRTVELELRGFDSKNELRIEN